MVALQSIRFLLRLDYILLRYILMNDVDLLVTVYRLPLLKCSLFRYSGVVVGRVGIGSRPPKVGIGGRPMNALSSIVIP